MARPWHSIISSTAGSLSFFLHLDNLHADPSPPFQTHEVLSSLYASRCFVQTNTERAKLKLTDQLSLRLFQGCLVRRKSCHALLHSVKLHRHMMGKGNVGQGARDYKLTILGSSLQDTDKLTKRATIMTKKF